MKRIIAGLFVGLSLLAACGSEPPAEPSTTPEATASAMVLPFSLPYYDNTSLHPITGTSQTNSTLTPLVYESLFEIDNQFRAVPMLAQDWSCTEDALRWTIHLKSDQFSDSTPLTGAEVAASLQLAKTSERYANRLQDVKSIAANGSTVTLTLTRPRGDLPLLLDIPIVKEQEDAPPLGTGYYTYEEQRGDLVLSGSPDLPEGLPQRIPLTPIQTADDLINAFDTKDISLVVADLTATDTLGFSGGYEIWEHPSTTMLYLGFRTDRGPCRDSALRQAISLALDRESIVNALYSLHGRAAVLPLSPASENYDESLFQNQEYSSRSAAQKLRESGYAQQDDRLSLGGYPVKLTLIVNTDNMFRLSAAQHIAGELEKLGLTVTVDALPWQEYTKRLSSGDFDLYLAETALTASFDLEHLLSAGGSLNYSRWNDPQTHSLLTQFRSASGDARAPAAQELYLHLLEQAPIAPILFKEQTVLTQWGQFSDLTPTRANCFSGFAWSVKN